MNSTGKIYNVSFILVIVDYTGCLNNYIKKKTLWTKDIRPNYIRGFPATQYMISDINNKK